MSYSLLIYLGFHTLSGVFFVFSSWRFKQDGFFVQVLVLLGMSSGVVTNGWVAVCRFVRRVRVIFLVLGELFECTSPLEMLQKLLYGRLAFCLPLLVQFSSIVVKFAA